MRSDPLGLESLTRTRVEADNGVENDANLQDKMTRREEVERDATTRTRSYRQREGEAMAIAEARIHVGNNSEKISARTSGISRKRSSKEGERKGGEQRTGQRNEKR